MSENDLGEILTNVSVFCFFSTIFMGIGLLFYGIAQDYIMYELYGLFNLLLSPLVKAGYISILETIDSFILMIPSFLDIIWFASFITLIGGSYMASYKAKREGYISALGFLIIGTFIFLFITALAVELSAWFQTYFIDAILSSVSYNTPFYTFYMSNIGIINSLLIVSLIIVNVFDFDMSTYFTRKDKEVGNDEAL